MKIKQLFEKQIDRPIEGVIHADDARQLRLEVEEFVLTKQIETRLAVFLDAYNDTGGKTNGAWIYGFYGSGKSHLLKMLALLLENRDLGGDKTLDLFVPKTDDEILKNDLKKAAAIPSKSILFNIDQKAPVINKQQADALLAVFVKVFDEMCGYYSQQPYIAKFERDLDHEGCFGKFKEAVKLQAKQDWEFCRDRPARFSSNVDAAYQAATGADVSGVLDKYRADYSLSIEDFAVMVNAYIEKQEKGFRLNFLVDEVGQYIAENTKLMTNLQTIAESLLTRCHGRAWLIVTAQEDLGDIIGELNKNQEHDFSKIQDRFSTRLNLTSENVEEVIRKRLLLKNTAGIETLTAIYHEHHNNFKTLFDLTDGAPTYRNFLDREHFIHTYPFIPYQFTLFQSSIRSLSRHNVFAGKHSSVGERSMLGVFQEVAKAIGDFDVGGMATFDRMFEGNRTAMKAESYASISRAEKNLDSAFAVRLLKVLFLVKYIKEFRATARNLCVLMCEGFTQDLQALHREVQAGLDLLEQQTYIQRNGECYEYLTSAEKDVEAEIKSAEVDSSLVAAELAKIVFDEIISDRKIKLPEGRRLYPFTRKLDDKAHGREEELTIHVASPFHPQADNEQVLRMQSMGKYELLLVMSAEERLVTDLLMYMRTQKYVSQNTTNAQTAEIRGILQVKGIQNQERRADVRRRVKELMGKASIFVIGEKVDIGGEDPQTRIGKGFADLVARTYPNLRMLRDVEYTEDMVGHLLETGPQTLAGLGEAALSEAEQEMLNAVRGSNQTGVRSTVRSVREKFEHRPYGWDYASILCVLAKLCAYGKIEVRSDGAVLENSALETALLNSQRHAGLLLEPQVDFSAQQVAKLRKFFQDFFDAPPQATEAKALAREFVDKLKVQIESLAQIARGTSEYPFLSRLSAPLVSLQEIAKKPYNWHLTDLEEQKEALMKWKTELFSPVVQFMSGSQRKIYDRARTMVMSQEANFSAVDSAGPLEIRDILGDSECFNGGKIPRLKTLTDQVEAAIAAALKAARDAACLDLAKLEERLKSMDEFSLLTGENQGLLLAPFDSIRQQVGQASLVAVIRDTIRRFEDQAYQALLGRMCDLARPAPTGAPAPGGVREPSVEYVAAKSISVPFGKAWLASKEDVAQYLAAAKTAYQEAIQSGKRIRI